MKVLPSRFLPKILCSNVRSILNKMDEARHVVLSQNVDIFACSESWLKSTHADNIVAIPGYNCFRDDRQYASGGGVAVWVKDSIVAKRFPVKFVGCECVILTFPVFQVVFVALYVPPNEAVRASSSISDLLIDKIDNVMEIFPNFEVILCGDLNRMDISQLCTSLNLRNIFNKPTYGNSQLDYILLSDDLCSDFSISDFPPIDLSKTPHLCLLAIPKSKNCDGLCVFHQVYDLRSSYVDSFVMELACVNWSFVYDTELSLNDKCDKFHGILQLAVDKCIPVSYVKCTRRDKPWMTPVIKDMINKRWLAFRTKDFQIYNHLKVKIREEIAKSKLLWTKKVKTKNVWKAVHAQLGTKSSNPIMNILSQYTDIQVAVEAINSALASVFSTGSNKVDVINGITESEDWKVNVTPYLIHKLIERMPSNKASADIPTVLYKRAGFLLAEPLSHLFQQSINECIVPNIWKVSSICPIPKGQTPSISDIRPISLLPFPAKLLEKLVVESLKDKFIDCFGRQQFGFRPNSSTQCALVSLHEHLTQYLDDSSTDGAMLISYDMSKAFDTLTRDVILQRLIACKFPQQFLHWIRSYLAHRKQFVRIGCSTSSTSMVTSGVPQGSVLGPYLFALTVSSFSPVSKDVHVVKYADDFTFCLPIYKSSSNLHVSLVHEQMLEWTSSVDLTLNTSKCKSLTIPKTNHCDKISLPGVTNVSALTVLGVTFNQKLTWSSHFDNVIRNTSRRFYALRVLKPLLTKVQLRNVYYALIRSLLEYCAPLFVGASMYDVKRVNSVQRRFHRLMCGKECVKHCLPSLENRRSDLALRFLKSITPHHVLYCELPRKSRTGRFILPPRRTERRCKSFVLTACKMFNLSMHRR